MVGERERGREEVVKAIYCGLLEGRSSNKPMRTAHVNRTCMNEPAHSSRNSGMISGFICAMYMIAHLKQEERGGGRQLELACAPCNSLLWPAPCLSCTLMVLPASPRAILAREQLAATHNSQHWKTAVNPIMWLSLHACSSRQSRSHITIAACLRSVRADA